MPAFLGLWWLTFLASGFLVGVGSQMWDGAETFSQLELAALVEISGDFLGVLSGVLAYVVVDRTSERQQARATKLATWRAPLPQT